MRTVAVFAFVAVVAMVSTAAERPVPSPALKERLENGPEVIGIVHWGLNTYTDREWGFGNENPAMLNPAKFDADQIVQACKEGGIGGLVIVAKHHDGFCLWPTKTAGHNITKSPFRGGRGDYVREMQEACRRAALKFGVYVSPWDRSSEHYATEKYVETFNAQLKELLGGDYGDVFEMWFDGANGGTGWYGGANERRTIGKDYYRFGEVVRTVRALQPGITVFGGGNYGDFRWPGNERGILDGDSRATIVAPDDPAYRGLLNVGTPDGACFRACESDFPQRNGWFYHESERGSTKSAAYLMKLYLSSVGNAGTMNIGVAPNKDGVLDDADVRSLAGFGVIRRAFFANEVTPGGGPFNVVVMSEDISKGEQVDAWEFATDGKTLLSGKSIGVKRIRVLESPVSAENCELRVLKDGGNLQGVSFKLYLADTALVKTVLAATTESGETDTAKWMAAPCTSAPLRTTKRQKNVSDLRGRRGK
jgi:alpha-L-fucosidase